jgi:hypothetical protein
MSSPLLERIESIRESAARLEQKIADYDRAANTTNLGLTDAVMIDYVS